MKNPIPNPDGFEQMPFIPAEQFMQEYFQDVLPAVQRLLWIIVILLTIIMILLTIKIIIDIKNCSNNSK